MEQPIKPAEPKIEYVFCSDECGEKTPRETIEGSGWDWLQITNRYRCVNCWRALQLVNKS